MPAGATEACCHTSRKSEYYFDAGADGELHGFEGLIYVTFVSASDPKRVYGLREPVREVFLVIGVRENDGSSGSMAGISEYAENWRRGLRQAIQRGVWPQGRAALTQTMVQRLLFVKNGAGKQVATGTQLADSS